MIVFRDSWYTRRVDEHVAARRRAMESGKPLFLEVHEREERPDWNEVYRDLEASGLIRS